MGEKQDREKTKLFEALSFENKLNEIPDYKIHFSFLSTCISFLFQFIYFMVCGFLSVSMNHSDFRDSGQNGPPVALAYRKRRLNFRALLRMRTWITEDLT